MANTQAICTSFKPELLGSFHNFASNNPARTVNTRDAFKAALYLTTATVDSTTTAYAAGNEVAGAGYVAGGIAVTNAVDPTSSGTTGYWTPSGNLVYATVTIGPTDAVLVYNSTNGNRAVSVHTFGSQTVTAANLTLTMPANAAGTALLRLT